MAQYNASMESRGQPTVVASVSRSGASRTVLEEAHAGEEQARRELMEAAQQADALAALPVAAGSAVGVVSFVGLPTRRRLGFVAIFDVRWGCAWLVFNWCGRVRASRCASFGSADC